MKPVLLIIVLCLNYFTTALHQINDYTYRHKIALINCSILNYQKMAVYCNKRVFLADTW